MRGHVAKTLRGLAGLLVKQFEIPETTYLRHQVTGELRLSGAGAVYKYAKQLHKRGKDYAEIFDDVARAIAQSLDADRRERARVEAAKHAPSGVLPDTPRHDGGSEEGVQNVQGNMGVPRSVDLPQEDSAVTRNKAEGLVRPE